MGHRGSSGDYFGKLSLQEKLEEKGGGLLVPVEVTFKEKGRMCADEAGISILPGCLGIEGPHRQRRWFLCDQSRERHC